MSVSAISKTREYRKIK